VSAPPLTVERVELGTYRVQCAGSCGAADTHHHVVTIRPDVIRCDCPAGAFRRPCRHAKAVTEHLILAPLVLSSEAGPGLERDLPVPDDQADGSA